MKIGIVHRNMRVVGGGTRWTKEVIHHLRLRGHDVQLFTHDGEAPRLLPRSYQNLWMAKKMAETVRKAGGLDCLLLCSEMEFSPLFRGVAPLIGVLHEVAFLRRLRVHGWRRLLQAPARGMGYMDFTALDAVVVNSNFTADNVGELFPETHVVYPGVDHGRFTPEGSTDGGFLVYVARFSPGDKNHSLAIEIARRLHAPLVLAGSLASKEYLDSLPRPPEAEFRCDVADDELLGLYRRSSIYLHPSIREAFGLTVLEAMACGKPVVVHEEGGGAREIAEGYGLIAGSVEEWLEAVGGLLSSDERRRGVGERCRERSLMFGWDRTAEGLEAVMEGIV